MTLTITTLCIKCHYGQCPISFIALLNAVMLSVVMLNFIMMSAVALNVIMVNVIMLHVVMMSILVPNNELNILYVFTCTRPLAH